MSLSRSQNHTTDVLPPDLLSHIFMLCLPDDERASPSLSTAPLSLTTVCIAWRSVALDTPKLWLSFHIKFLSTDWLSTLQVALKTWASRAGPYALSLGISWDIKSDVDSDIDDLDPTTYDACWNAHSFVTFVDRSMCSLTRLSLFEVHMSSSDLLYCLRVLSATLVELHMEGGQCDMVDADVLHALTYLPPVPPKAGSSGKKKRKKRKGTDLCSKPIVVYYIKRPLLCPNLERFCARGYVFDKSDSRGNIVDMIESRYYQSFPLPDVKQLRWVYIGGQFNAEDWARIGKLKKKGLELLVVEEGNWYKPRYIDDPALFE